MTEQLIEADGVQLCVDSFGRDDDPTLLLIAGGGQSMVWWEVGFCERLADHGLRVVRYDHRDTGRSTCSPAGAPPYTNFDFVGDPLRILDTLGVARAHLAGLSMGGGIAQLIALRHPERLATLSLFSTTPAAPADTDRALPPPTPEVAATFTDPGPEPDWADRDAAVAYRIDIERPYMGSCGLDERRCRQLAELEVDRTTDMAAALTNHFMLEDDVHPDARLSQITAPTLVLHGTTDPLFPLAHGRALADEIPGARLVELPGVGHQQPPPELWDPVVAAITAHVRA